MANAPPAGRTSDISLLPPSDLFAIPATNPLFPHAPAFPNVGGSLFSLSPLPSSSNPPSNTSRSSTPNRHTNQHPLRTEQTAKRGRKLGTKNRATVARELLEKQQAEAAEDKQPLGGNRATSTSHKTLDGRQQFVRKVDASDSCWYPAKGHFCEKCEGAYPLQKFGFEKINDPGNKPMAGWEHIALNKVSLRRAPKST